MLCYKGDIMGELSKLPNISTVIEAKLNAAGITTAAELSTIGSKDAFIRIRLQDSTVCLNMLYALEGANQNIRWHHLPDEKKAELKSFYKSL